MPMNKRMHKYIVVYLNRVILHSSKNKKTNHIDEMHKYKKKEAKHKGICTV